MPSAGIIHLTNFSKSEGIKRHLCVGLICISLITKEFEHLFLFSLYILISFSANWFFKLCASLGVLASFSLNYRGFLYMRGIGLLLVLDFANNFSVFYQLPSSMISTEEKALISVLSAQRVFCLMVYNLRRSSPHQGQKICWYIF